MSTAAYSHLNFEQIPNIGTAPECRGRCLNHALQIEGMQTKPGEITSTKETKTDKFCLKINGRL